MRAARIIFGIVIALYSLSATSEEKSVFYHNVNGLLRYCESEDATERVACMSYLAGLTDMAEVMASAAKLPRFICKPNEVPIKQLRKIFIKYANDRPESLHLSAASIAGAAFAEAFPCNQ